MSEKKVRKTGADQKKMKTRCYYTDYVNHAIRFYLTCPEVLQTAGKRKADIDNWMAVQSVFHGLTAEQKQILIDVYGSHHRVTEGVRIYCEKTGADNYSVWVLVTKVSALIARRRGLV